MSRSAFALRFKEMVGETPLEYLTAWRMQKAAALMQKGDQKLIDVARSVGYEAFPATSIPKVRHYDTADWSREIAGCKVPKV